MQNSAITDLKKKKSDKQKSNIRWVFKPAIEIQNKVGPDLSKLTPTECENNVCKPSTTKKIAKRGLIITFLSTIFHWLNGSTSNQIDIDLMKRRNDQRLGIWKWNL